MKIISFILAIAAIVAVNYYAEHNRAILLFIVYPTIAFGTLGLYAIWEHRQFD